MGRPSKRGTWAGTWEGGRVWRGADGVDVYYIRRQVGGQRYSCSTGATTRRAALVQLGRFEGDPDHYRPANDPATAPLYLDNDLSEAFRLGTRVIALERRRNRPEEKERYGSTVAHDIAVWPPKKQTKLNGSGIVSETPPLVAADASAAVH